MTIDGARAARLTFRKRMHRLKLLRSWLFRLMMLFLPVSATASEGATEVGSVDSVSTMLDLQTETTRKGQATQRRIDELADETRDIVSEYRLKLQALERVRRYNANLERTVDDQERQKASLDRQIEEFGDFEQGIVPLMMDMIDDLAEFIELDIPFLLAERRARIERLRDTMGRSDVSVSEKFRQIMSAYMVETAFGRTIEAYRGEITADDGTVRKVEFFRLGRALLAYQTPDRQLAGYWDSQQQAWRELDSRFARSVNLGLRIAKKQAAPELLVLPVAAPVAAPIRDAP